MRRQKRVRKYDDGIALVSIVGAMLILATFLLTMVAFTVSAVPGARRDQDGKIAMASAQTGLEDYMSRLNADTDYWKNWGTPTVNPAIRTPRGRFSRGSIQGTGGRRPLSVTMLPAPRPPAPGIVRLQVTGISSPGAAGRTPGRAP